MEWTPRIVARQQTPCWPWRLRERHDTHPVGAQCVECGQDVALDPTLRGFDPVCLYCALGNGTLPAVEIEPTDERTLHQQAMDWRRGNLEAA